MDSNNLKATIYLREDTDNTKYKENEILRCMVKEIGRNDPAINKKVYFEDKYNNEIVVLSINPKDLDADERDLDYRIDNWKEIKGTFNVIKEEDFPAYSALTMTKSNYIPRKINHPKFRNMSYTAAIEYLSDKSIGEFVIRPSSKGI